MTPSALVVLAVLTGARPEIPLERAETIAQAIDMVSGEFPDHPMLPATLLATIENESGFREDVHSGELRGKAGEVCLTQIHPTNGFWKGYVAEFDDLAGIDLESTTNCLRVAARTLQYSRTTCLKENFKTNWAQAMWTRYHYGSRCWLSPHAYKRTRDMWRWHRLLAVQERKC